jgi:hypothetical protein
VSAFDLLSFVVAVAVLALAAPGACRLPARRAMRIDPFFAHGPTVRRALTVAARTAVGNVP